jgi:hypothetical protein
MRIYFSLWTDGDRRVRGHPVLELELLLTGEDRPTISSPRWRP